MNKRLAIYTGLFLPSIRCHKHGFMKPNCDKLVSLLMTMTETFSINVSNVLSITMTSCYINRHPYLIEECEVISYISSPHQLTENMYLTFRDMCITQHYQHPLMDLFKVIVMNHVFDNLFVNHIHATRPFYTSKRITLLLGIHSCYLLLYFWC